MPPVAFGLARWRRMVKARNGADQGIAVGCEGEGAVDHPLDSRPFQNGIAFIGVLQGLRDAFQIVRQQFVAEIPWGPVDRPGVAGLFVDADHQAASFLAQIALTRRVHAVGQLGLALVDLGNFSGHQVLVFHGMERQKHPHHGPHFTGPKTGRIDHVLRPDGALFRNHVPTPVGMWLQIAHWIAQIDLGTLLPRSLGIGLSRPGRI